MTVATITCSNTNKLRFISNSKHKFEEFSVHLQPTT